MINIKQASRVAAKVNELIGAKFPLIAELTTKENHFYRVDDSVAIMVEHDFKGFVRVLLAFEQRPGVWHALGNFIDDPIYEKTLRRLGVTITSTRNDLNTNDAVMLFARRLAAAVTVVKFCAVMTKHDDCYRVIATAEGHAECGRWSFDLTVKGESLAQRTVRAVEAGAVFVPYARIEQPDGTLRVTHWYNHLTATSVEMFDAQLRKLGF